MEHSKWRFIALILFAVVPIFGGAIIGMPLLSVLWTAGLIFALPFVVMKIVKDGFASDDEIENQIKRVQLITGNAPSMPNSSPPPIPQSAPISPHRSTSNG